MSPALAGRLPALKSLSLGSSSNVLSKTNHATLLSPKFLLPAPPPSSTASGGPGSEAESREDGSAGQRAGREADGSVSLGGRGPLPESTVSTFFILLVERLVRLAAREWKLPTPGVRPPAQDVCIFTFPGRNRNPAPPRPYNAVPCFRGQAPAERTQHADPSLVGLETHSCLLTPHSPNHTHTHTHNHPTDCAGMQAKKPKVRVVSW